MIKSMTGYGRGECSKYNRKFVVEIKSVNHRYNDINVKLPRVLSGLEDSVRKMVSAKVNRGKTDVYVNYEALGDTDVTIKFNEVLADEYYKVLNSIKERYCMEDKISISSISRFQDVISVDRGIDDKQEMAEMQEVLFEAVNDAVVNLIEMREKEGASLKNDMLEKLKSIEAMSAKIIEKAPAVAQMFREKLTQRLAEALKDTEIDEARILTEVTIFADRSCIDEEITRLGSHIEQMKSILEENDSIGRKLDFLVQEMNREVNTIGSKASDIEITQIVVDLKSEIEKIREQIQNIE